MQQYVTFYVNDELLGMDISFAHEVCHKMELAPVDLCLPYVCGLMNLRGKIVTVIDLALKLGLPEPTGFSRAGAIIVLRTRGELTRLHVDVAGVRNIDSPVGLLVDRIGDVIEVDDPECVEGAPAHVNGIEGFYVSKVIKLKGALLTVLKMSDVLALPANASDAEVRQADTNRMVNEET